MTYQFNPDQLYLTVDQVARRYAVSADTIWRWSRNGDFPRPRKIGPNVTRWRLADLDEHDQQFRASFAGYDWSLAIAC